MKDAYYHICKRKIRADDLYFWGPAGRIGPKPGPLAVKRRGHSQPRTRIKLQDLLKGPNKL